MSYRSPARWLAPLALLGAAVAILVTVSSSGSGSNDPGITGTPSTAPRSSASTRTTAGAAQPTAPAHRTYTVQPGDVLSAIAEKTGVSLERVQALNPTVDAQSLHAGQKLKLSP